MCMNYLENGTGKPKLNSIDGVISLLKEDVENFNNSETFYCRLIGVCYSNDESCRGRSTTCV